MNIIIRTLLERHHYSDAMNAALRIFSDGNTSPVDLKKLINVFIIDIIHIEVLVLIVIKPIIVKLVMIA